MKIIRQTERDVPTEPNLTLKESLPVNFYIANTKLSNIIKWEKILRKGRY